MKKMKASDLKSMKSGDRKRLTIAIVKRANQMQRKIVHQYHITNGDGCTCCKNS